jgi:Transposase DDE domain group 1
MARALAQLCISLSAPRMVPHTEDRAGLRCASYDPTHGLISNRVTTTATSRSYTERGQTENGIKDLKVALKADGLSCQRLVANQFRLLLHAAAYWLMDTLRKKLVDGGIERMQLDTLRLKLVKIGGRVRELLSKVRIHLASGHPGQHLWHALWRAFGVVHEYFGLRAHRRAIRLLAYLKHASHGLRHELGVRERGQLHEPCPVWVSSYEVASPPMRALLCRTRQLP